MANLKILSLLERELKEETSMIQTLEKRLKQSLKRRSVIIESIISITKTIVDAGRLNTTGGINKTKSNGENFSSTIGHASQNRISKRRKLIRSAMRKYVELENKKREVKANSHENASAATNKIHLDMLDMNPIVKVLKDVSIDELSATPSVALTDQRRSATTSPLNDPLLESDVPNHVDPGNSTDFISSSTLNGVELSSEVSLFVKKVNKPTPPSINNNNNNQRELENNTIEENVNLEVPHVNNTSHNFISVKSENYSDIVEVTNENGYGSMDNLVGLEDTHFDYYHGLSDNSTPLPDETDPISLPKEAFDYCDTFNKPGSFEEPLGRKKSTKTKARYKPKPRSKTDGTSCGRRILYRERLRFGKLKNLGKAEEFKSHIVCFICKTESFDGVSLYWRSCKICQSRFASSNCYGVKTQPYTCSECAQII